MGPIPKVQPQRKVERLAPEPPHNLEAEETVLGAMMLAPAAIDLVVEEATATDFYRDSHAKIYKAAVSLYADDQTVDPITLAEELRRRGQLDDVGGKQRLHEIAAIVPAWKNAGHYARIIREKAVARALIRVGQQVQALGWEGVEDSSGLVEQAQELIFDLAQERARFELTPIGSHAINVYEQLVRLHETGLDVIGLPTGFHHFDQLTSGLQNGNLITIAARPGMGKSALVTGIAEHAAIKMEKPVALFTLEMSKDEITQRLLSLEAMVDGSKLRTGKLAQDDWNRVHLAMGRIEKAPLYVHDDGAATMLDIRSQARKLKLREPDLALVIVDYLQLMASGANHENRVQEVSQVSRSLKVLARELDVPVVAVSQLSRACEARHDKRPLLSDLRESGSIEQDSDLVVFVYRDEYYNPEDREVAGLAELIVSKHRNGPLGTVKLTFVKSKTRFSDPVMGLV